MRVLLILLLVGFLGSGCKVLNPSIMFKTNRDQQYTELNDSTFTRKYLIASDDQIEFRLFSNSGAKLIDLTNVTTGNDLISRNNIQYVVENDSVRVPVVGKVKVAGMTIPEAENFLEQLYSKYYVDPFVVIRILNKRVIVFPGSGSAARVVTLANNNTTLIETLALAGGITDNGKAYKIKLIRHGATNPQIFLIDLSKISGVREANLVVQGDDIIYVEPRIQYAREILNEVTPILTLLSTALLVYGLIIKN